MKRALRIALLTALFYLCCYSTASAQEAATSATPTVGDLALVLAPLVAAATAVERIIEMLFNWYESVLMNAGSFLGLGGAYVKWAQQQVSHHQQAVLAIKAGSQPTGASGLSSLAEAEEKLAAAQERLLGWLESPFYTSRKKVATLIMGLILGIALAFATRLRMLALLGLQPVSETGAGAIVPWMDMLLTGLIIGTGSAPVHSLIGLLQNTKDAVGEARALWKGKAIAEVQGVLAELRREVQPAEPTRVMIVPQSIEEMSPEQLAALAEALQKASEPARAMATPAPQVSPPSDVEIQRAARRLLR